MEIMAPGESFKAAKEILKDKFKNIPIAGIFIARAINYL
jgi:hypothetical protein